MNVAHLQLTWHVNNKRPGSQSADAYSLIGLFVIHLLSVKVTYLIGDYFQFKLKKKLKLVKFTTYTQHPLKH